MRKRLLCYFPLMLGGMAAPLAGQVPARCTDPIARIVERAGTVEVQPAGVTVFTVAVLDDVLCPGDSVRTGPRSRATIESLTSQGGIRIDQGTTIQIQDGTPGTPQGGRSLIDLLNGILYFFSPRPAALDVRTPYVTAGVEGTEFLVAADPDRTLVSVFEGIVRMQNDAGELVLAANQSGQVLPGQAPELILVAAPRDAVQWAVYYQPVSVPLIDPVTDDPQGQAILASIEAYRGGDLAEAFERLEALPEPDRGSPFYVYRAGLLLSVGAAEEARSDLEGEALQRAPDDGDAHALLAVIAVAENDRELALQEGSEAVRLSPDSAAAWIGLSYAQQANFELEAARDSLLDAVRVQPANALAWARLSELWLSLGDLDRALEAAEEAATLDPNVGRTHTVRGFAELTRVDLDAATASFERALQVEPQSSLARLGLGLAKIRDGDLDAGREDIEIAVTLDPNNALIRSYLGKAYFEEREDALAAEQLAIAKELDPNDPTPYFYDAIRKQTVNRPVEALRDLQESIRLSDNRAVYRSRLLLDQDLGMRGASLGRIYQDLGFDRIALIEGAQSVAIDPANHSAHRFLADSYANRPGHKIAQASELLRAQLLQPISINPIQPRLGETDLNIVSSVGPAQATFNEFTPLFERDNVQLVASGFGGNHSAWGDEAVLSGIEGRVSYSIGQFHFQDKGFRENNDLGHDIYNLFAQVQLTPKLNIQGEYRRRETEQGDLSLNFDPDDFSSTKRREFERDTVRMGAAVRPSHHSSVLGSISFIQGSDEFDIVDTVFDFRSQNTTERNGYDAQGQYILSRDFVTVTAGGGIYAIDDEILDVFEDYLFDFTDVLRESTSTKQYNSYAYTSWNFSDLSWTLGLSYAAFDDEVLDLDGFHPKLGITWRFATGARLRAAYTKSLIRTLLVDQTLEPTQLAGFNQFFDDLSGTRAERYGIAIDGAFEDARVYGGLEFARRNLRVPIPLFGVPGMSPAVTFENHRQDMYSGYLYWVPADDYTLTVEYQLERLRNFDVVLIPSSSLAQTTIVPLRGRYFHPAGLFAELSGTYVRQRLGLVGFSGVTSTQREDFALMDAAVGYRLPNRRGVLSFQVNNLLDRRFRFLETNLQTQEPGYPRFLPARTARAVLTITF